MYKTLRTLLWILRVNLRLDPKLLVRAFAGIPRYVRDSISFRREYRGPMLFRPCLTDWGELGGGINNEYFWADLVVAQKIYSANPRKHVDVGSRIDGFVAHVASFRQVEVVDVRPIPTQIPSVISINADATVQGQLPNAYCDSVSCLHALEHFGLGRYGDVVSPNGFWDGLENIANMLLPEGRFYLALPIGLERIEFNAHRITDPFRLLKAAKGSLLVLENFAWVESGARLIESNNPEEDMERLRTRDYALGIFVFKKTGM